MKQGIKLLKRKMRATRPQDFKQELTRNYPEIIFQREWPRMTANVRKYFFEQQLPAIGQQLASNLF